METVVKVYPNRYYDSVQLMFTTSAIKKKPGIRTALVAMATQANKDIFKDIGMDTDSIQNAGPNDMIIGVAGFDENTCEEAITEILDLLENNRTSKEGNSVTYSSIETAVKENPKANLCVISVPGEYARKEAEKALNAGLHTLIFSDSVSLKDEREIKLLAAEKGLICMGPDCGVANINGISFLVGSVVRKGSIGICAASGVGLQEVAALIHESGSGVSQGIGTGGRDLKDEVGGLTMLAGIDALEKDEETKIIVLISRKPENNTLDKILNRVKNCVKPVVICFMGCEKEELEGTGAIYVSNLEDCAREALSLAGINYRMTDTEEFMELAKNEVSAMSTEQKYVRGLFCGGTFTEEAMVTMKNDIGDIYSNAPLREELRLEESTVSFKNSVVDYGAEEFTINRPHPVIDTEPRAAGILREAQDPELAVLLLDFVLGPAVNSDPVGSVINNIKTAMKMASERGGKLSVVASVCGTEADPQKLSVQEKMLKDAGVIVCSSNYQAALLAGKIIKCKMERDGV
ncbi:MAG: FdrA family protein [Clostridiaceae bacterium]|nr:FdrA family protein [Clostridiaceae bacterium]